MATPATLPCSAQPAQLAEPSAPAAALPGPSPLAARNRAPVRLWWPAPALGHCVRAILARSTLGLGQAWPSAWHYNHFPATPLCSIGWFSRGHSSLLDAGAPPTADSPGQRLPSVYFCGPFSRPSVSRNSAEGQGMMLVLLPDAVQALTGLNPADWVNRIAPLHEALGADWQAWGQAVLQAEDDDTRVRLIEDFLTPRWQAARPQGAWPGWPRLQDWAQALALRAAHTGAGRSLRQAERRIKGWAGLPLRELRGLGRAEQAFLKALAQGEAPVRWSEVAADSGYADQSHLCRETRRITGFAPAELRRRMDEEEGFWLYRVWC